MKKYLFSLLAIMMLATACETEDVAPAIDGGHVPGEVVGKWMWGSFSYSNFWSYDGQYAGKPWEQALVLVFKANGEFEEYVINATTSYNCKTEAFTFLKGAVDFNEAEGTFTLTPTEGNYRGFYSCTPGSNFNRAATAQELQELTKSYYYTKMVKEGKTYFVMSSVQSNLETGIHMEQTSW
ncbi:hypothetical protein [Cesiribacter sp. SM1]|uniref:hypothetical protein n=1 Tax=Cesiribacter sp. SM1 TaxID=2861196 RepID=UPI001CD55B61|nr:hypothetical protein [Cesiribacter sp. SM1]